MRVAASVDGETFGESLRFDTPVDFDEGLDTLAAAAQELAGESQIKAAAGGIAGPLNRAKDMVINAPNLPGWNNRPFSKSFSERIGAPVYLENDSAIVGLGEAHAGAGRGFGITSYITVSTGVGGARIVDGRIDRNVMGFEPGHQVIDMDGTVLPTADTVEVEDYLSGTATEIRFGKKAYQVTDPAVWEELSRWLAYVLNNTIVHWSPDVVVLGGSMMVGDPAIPLDRVEHHLREILTIFPELPVLKLAELRDVGGLHGALVYIKQQHGDA
jgi:glucokinase